VSFGPAWHDKSTGRDVPPDKLTPIVRAAARQLVEDLRRAETLTDKWSDPGLADVLVAAALDECLERLAATSCWGEANRVPSNELWRIAGPVLEAGWLQHRARFKPLGYAGDFEMLARICGQTSCPDPLGRAFDHYFLSLAAPQAVRARTQQTTAAMVAHCLKHDGETYRVVSVGSGPAIDVCDAVSLLPGEHRGRLRVTLLEIDPKALEFARAKLALLLPDGSFECVRTNLFRLPQTAARDATFADADFLVCPGLFDYLEDAPAIAMLRHFRQQLRAGGLLLVGNFAPHNPTRAYMEWIGNWYLLYRTAEQLHRLAVEAGMREDRFQIGSERLGVNLFLVARKEIPNS